MMFQSSNVLESRIDFLKNFRNSYLLTALYDAVIDADLATTKFLLEFKKVNPNFIVADYDAAPLHAAPGIGTEDLALISVNMLLYHGADPNITTSDGTTPLMISCLWGRENTVKRLLDSGADPFLKDAEGKNSFDYALESDKESVYSLLTRLQGGIISYVLKDTVSETVKKKVANEANIGEKECIKTELIEFTDIDSDATMVEFNSLNTGFINLLDSGVITVTECHKVSNNNEILTIGDNQMNSKNLPDNQNESEDNSFVTVKSSSTQVSLTSCNTDYLKNELKRNKIDHGPVTQTTKNVYKKLLSKVIKGKRDNVCEVEFFYYPEILKNTFKENFVEIINKWYIFEKLLSRNFLDENKCWRGGKEKQFFTYLLLDPSLTNNLPQQKNDMKDVDVWKTFVLSIFYVGKGKNSRPFSHLYEAIRTMTKKSLSAKVRKIQSIWDKSSGVICLHIFHNVISAEAHTREAAMIDAIDLRNLTNVQSGQYYGIVKNWSTKQKRQLGMVLLYKALQIYLAEGERQIFPSDLA